MEKRPSLSETQPRTCPSCGSSVSSRAKTCLICGAELTPTGSFVAPQPVIAPQPVAQKPFQRVFALVGGVIVLGLLVVGGLQLRSRAATPPVPPTLTPTATLVATPTLPPTETPTPLPPTSTQTATPIPTQANTAVPPTVYKVRPNDTLGTIADKFDTTIEAIQAFNGLSDADVIQVGQDLQIPAAGSTPNPTVTPRATETFEPGPTPGTVLHVVQSGDTLLGIALKYGVGMTIIQKANDIEDPESIKEGQQLVIPIGPTATAAAGPSPTPTGPPKYTAPFLLSPLDAATFEGNDEPILLQWASVSILRQNEYYFVQLEQLNSGTPPATFLTRATGWHVSVDLFPKPGDTRRTFAWQVRVVRETGTHADGTPILSDAGPASATRTFSWLIANPTSTPTPGPTQ
jgi:LysM repeat protein